jgi:anti-anti-sigma factor
MNGLSIDLAEGTPPVLCVRGELDLATADEFRSALERAVSADPAVVVDMKDVTFIDLCGLRVILEAAESRNGRGPLRLVNAGRVAWLLDLAGLDEDKMSLDLVDGR